VLHVPASVHPGGPRPGHVAGLEADRKAAELKGVRFLYYRCPGCGTDDIFVDILPRDGEFAEDYERRRDEMEAVVRGLRADRLAAVVIPVGSP
jgi:hypothetical protein